MSVVETTSSCFPLDELDKGLLLSHLFQITTRNAWQARHEDGVQHQSQLDEVNLGGPEPENTDWIRGFHGSHRLSLLLCIRLVSYEVESAKPHKWMAMVNDWNYTVAKKPSCANKQLESRLSWVSKAVWAIALKLTPRMVGFFLVCRKNSKSEANKWAETAHTEISMQQNGWREHCTVASKKHSGRFSVLPPGASCQRALLTLMGLCSC